MNLHSVSNAAIKNTYEEQIRSSRGSQNERSSSLGAVSAKNLIYENRQMSSDYGNPIFEKNEKSNNQVAHYSNPSSVIESESF